MSLVVAIRSAQTVFCFSAPALIGPRRDHVISGEPIVLSECPSVHQTRLKKRQSLLVVFHSVYFPLHSPPEKTFFVRHDFADLLNSACHSVLLACRKSHELFVALFKEKKPLL